MVRLMQLYRVNRNWAAVGLMSFLAFAIFVSLLFYVNTYKEVAIQAELILRYKYPYKQYSYFLIISAVLSFLLAIGSFLAARIFKKFNPLEVTGS
jgi:hypothetical protein